MIRISITVKQLEAALEFARDQEAVGLLIDAARDGIGIARVGSYDALDLTDYEVPL